LLGAYFDNVHLDGVPAAQRIDGPIDLYWGDKPPLGINSDVRAQVAAQLWTKHLQDSSLLSELSPTERRDWIARFGDSLTDTARSQLLDRLVATPRLLEGISVPDLREMRRAFAGLADGRGGLLLAAWARMHPEGVFLVAEAAVPYYWSHHDRYWQVWAYDPDPAQLVHLNDALLLADGRINLAAARLLATAHADLGTLNAWRDELDQELADPSVQGDLRAQWLLARSYVDEAGYFERTPVATYPYLQQAYAEAQTLSVRQTVLRHYGLLFEHQCDAGQLDQALRLLNEMEERFTDKASQSLLGHWRHTTLVRDAVALAARQPWLAARMRRMIDTQLKITINDQHAQQYQELVSRLDTLRPQAAP
jgi:hypothetical protein